MKGFILAALTPIAFIMEGDLLADGYGQHMQIICNSIVVLPGVPQGMCHQLVVERFRALFPGSGLLMEDCVKRPEAEALMWGAIYDRGWADRYYARVAELCGGSGLK